VAATIYSVQNAALPTTAATVRVATGTSIKTLLQGTAASTKRIEICGWQVDMDGSPDGVVELIHTTTVAGGSATAVTPTVWSDSAGSAALSTWGFSPSTEGTVVATTRLLDLHNVKANQSTYWFPLAERPQVPASGVVRVRVSMTTGANALCTVWFTEP
jgi:hypothetical protein